MPRGLLGRASLFVVLLVTGTLLITNCSNPFSSSSSGKSKKAHENPSDLLSFNLTGAAAVGAAEMNVSASNLSTSSLLTGNAAESAFGLVKVLEDGSIEMAMDAPEDRWLPDVQFIAVSPDASQKSIYVSFDHDLYLGWDNDAGREIRVGSFLHIEEDGTYYEIMSSGGGRVRNYAWWGNDDYQPIDFDASGNVYFVWEDWTGGRNVEVMYRYNPVTHETTALTAQLSGYHYHSFQVSPDGSRLFVQGQRHSGGSQSNFFRMYPTANMTNPRTVFYSSSNDVWVRGYTIGSDGDSVFMNGNNIRGINGIMKAEFRPGGEINYAALFDSQSESFSPEYHEWYSDWENTTHRRGFFDRVNRWDSYVLMTDGSQFEYVRFDDAIRRNAIDDVHSTASLGGNLELRYTYEDLGFATSASDPTPLDGVTIQHPSHVIDVDSVEGVTRPGGDIDVDQVIFGYINRNWSNGQEQRTFVRMSDRVRDELIRNVLVGGGSNEYFTWNSHWIDEGGELNYAALNNYVAGFFVSDVEIQFEGQSGNAGWDAFRAAEPYARSFMYGPSYDTEHLLKTYFYERGTISNAKTMRQFQEENDLQWLRFEDIGTMFYDSLGNLWGVTGGGNWGGGRPVRPIRLLDSEGNRALAVLDALADDTYTPVGFAVDGDYLYFRDAVMDQDGFETGFHRLFRLDITRLNAQPEEVLTGMGSSRIEIVDFSIGGGYLYFTAVDGIQLVGGKVNLTTLQFTPFDSEYVIHNIAVY